MPTTDTEGHAPYLMPSYLFDYGPVRAPPRRTTRKQRARARQQHHWPAPAPRAPPPPASELEAAELTALERVGVRRRRRFLNDKLLRDLAGPMSAGDMASLFAPAPFGEVRESTLSVVMRQQGALWNHFLSIDYDKQANVLQRWEDHVLQGANSKRDASLDASVDAMRRWSRIPRKLRSALRGADADVVGQLELAMLQAVSGAAAAAEFEWDSFRRLLGHGLASFHGLVSTSRDVAGQRCIAFERRKGSVVASICCAEVLAAVQDAGPSGACHGALEAMTRGVAVVAAAS